MLSATELMDAYAMLVEQQAAADRNLPASRFGPQRAAAWTLFAERGFPTVGDEGWRGTNLAGLTKTAWPPLRLEGTHVTADDLRPFDLGLAPAVRMVFVNGSFEASLSDLRAVPAGVDVLSLAAMMSDARRSIPAELGTKADMSASPLTALNTALFVDGAQVRVADGLDVPTTIHLLYVAVPDRRGGSVQPRNLIVVGANSRVSVIEEYVTLGDGPYLNNAITEIVAGDGANVEHVKLIRESTAATHLGLVRSDQGRDSRYVGHAFTFGGGLVRHDLWPVLAGEGADCVLSGLYLLGGEQHADHNLRVEHAQPHGSSREYFRGILDGQSRGIFTGRIIVRPGAQKTDAKQTNNNLLLSSGAQADSRPQLEIYADDVKCTHGATIGQVDDDAVFYLRSRGLDETAARSLLTYAFAREALALLWNEGLRNRLAELILSRLPNSELLRDSL